MMRFAGLYSRNVSLGWKRIFPPQAHTQTAVWYHDPPQAVGSARQSETSPHESVSWLPMFVDLTATQKTNATKRTIKVYSTKPWPSSSTTNRLNKFIIRIHPLPSKYCSNRNCNPDGAEFMPNTYELFLHVLALFDTRYARLPLTLLSFSKA